MNNNTFKRKHSSSSSSSSSSSASASASPTHHPQPQPSSQKLKISLKIPATTLKTNPTQQPEERPKIKLRLFSKQLSANSLASNNNPSTFSRPAQSPKHQREWSPSKNDDDEGNQNAERETTSTLVNSKIAHESQIPTRFQDRSCSRSPSSRPSDQYPARSDSEPSHSRASSRTGSVGPDYSTSRPITPAPATGSKNSVSADAVVTETPTVNTPGSSSKGKKTGGKGKTRGSGYTYVRKGKGTGIAWAPRKKELSVICLKLLESFRRKDPYGFFLEPVDTSVITDYLAVVSNPMDFGTMKTKAATGRYKTMDEFKDDFDLIIRNAKTYNAPSTVYWCTADKISEYGHKSIARDASSVMTEEEVRAEREREEAKRLRKLGKSGKKGLKAAGVGNSGMNPGTPSALAEAMLRQRRSQSYMSVRGDEDLDIDGTGVGTSSAFGGYTLSYPSAAHSPNSGGASFSMGTPMQSSSYFPTAANGNDFPPPFHPNLVSALGSDTNLLKTLDIDLNSSSAFTTLLDTPSAACSNRPNHGNQSVINSVGGKTEMDNQIDYNVVTAALDADGTGVAIVQKRQSQNREVISKEVGTKSGAGLSTRTYLPDGSVDCGANDPTSIVPGYYDIDEGMVNHLSVGCGMIMAPRLTLIASKQSDAADMPTKIATFLDYGPFATLGPPTGPKTVEHSSYLYLTYGDERGEAYVRSLESFVMWSVGGGGGRKRAEEEEDKKEEDVKIEERGVSD